MRGSERSERSRWTAAGLVGLAALAVYLRTLYPSVPGGDAGELITAAARLEVAHPPGYPLYTLLAKLATLLPLGSVAWRVNLLSAVADAAAAAVLAMTVAQATRVAAAGALAGLLFAFSPLVWSYAVGAEVFPLNNLVVALLCWSTLRWRRSGARRDAVLVAALVGLGLAHHHAIVFYEAPILAWLLWSGAPPLPVALAAASGLAWYLYLPLAARSATTLSWGDPTTLAGFLHHVLRRDYGTFQLATGVDPDAAGIVARLTAWAAHTTDATLVLGAVLAIAAVGALAWPAARAGGDRERAWLGLWIVCLATYVLGFHALANLPVHDPLYRGVTARFWQQIDVVVFLLVGLGIGTVRERLGLRAGFIVLAVGWVLLAAQLGRGIGTHDHHADDTVARYGRALLEPLPPDTLLLTRGDLPTNVTRYLQTCDGVRRDVVILDQELLTKPWYVARAARDHPELRFPGAVYDPARADGFSMRTFLDANADGRPIAVYPEWKSGDPSTSGVYELTPRGLALAVTRVEAAPALEVRRSDGATALRTLDEYGWKRLGSYARGTWERVAREDVWSAQHRYGWWLLTQAIEPDADPGLLTAARVHLERAAHSHPDPPWFVFRNLGMAYERLALGDRKFRALQVDAWRRYLATAPADDEGRSAIAATVTRLEITPE